ncbi:MAG: ABC transporter permease [Candidatus Izemoplasmatales bacterium]
MRNVLTIFKKEWDRVFKDRRLILSVMVLPGLMIFILYTFIGQGMSNFITPDEELVAIANAPTAFTTLWNAAEADQPVTLATIEPDDFETYRDRVDAADWQLVIVFPENFEDDLGVDKPEIVVYYNPNETDSTLVFERFAGYLVQYQEALSTELYGDTEAFAVSWASTEVDEAQMVGTLMSTLLPMLVVMFLFSGAMAIGPESIAGEKERGTIATLLVTPVKRREIALGKVLSLGVLSLISAVSSFIGIISSLPNLFATEGVDMNVYGVSDYLLILALLFSTVFVIVGIIAIVSAYARNMKEAGTLITPIYLITIVIGVSTMFSDGAAQSWWIYLIPIYNTVQTLTAILTFDPAAPLWLLVTVLSNLVFTAVFVFILNRMFDSERVMFAK